MNFSAGDKVLCYHGPLIYQAKVLEAEIWTGEDPSEGGFVGPHYFVHYQGWKQSWDEWVPESRMLKLNDDNIARQKALVAAAKRQKEEVKESAAGTSAAQSSSGSSSKGASAAQRSRGRKSDDYRRNGSTGDSSRAAKRSRLSGADGVAGSSLNGRGISASGTEEDESLRKPEIKISIPDSLRVQLVDDWENVTKKGLVVPLPRSPTVKDILKMYRDHVAAKKKEGKVVGSNAALSVLDEVLQGLEVYFDKALGNNLLYRSERQQYLQVRRHGVDQGGSPETSATVGGSKTSRGGTSAGLGVNSSTSEEERAPSEIYGAEHLLRLFVNLPSIIAHTTMDVESISILREHLDDFLAFMVKEKARLFGKYQETSAVYTRLSNI